MSEKKAPNIPVRPGSDPSRFHYRNVNGVMQPICVYNVNTGEAVPCTFVDGREMVGTGHYSWQPPAAGDDSPEAA